MSNYNSLKNSALVTPTGNTDLGSPANRYGNVYLSGNLAIGNSVASESNLISPRISSVSYVGDDTAADPTGGQSITITGSGFRTGAVVYVAGSVVSLATVVSSTTIVFTSPAKSAGNYTLIVVNTDGGTATFIPGVQYSGTPVWSTSAGSLANVYESSSVSANLIATSDSTVSYSISSGALPTGVTLNSDFSGMAVLSGTAPAVASGSSTYNFTANAKDGENQDTTRNFSMTVNADTVTWNSPANASSLTATSGTLYSQALSATSAAGRSITYTANSLPTGLSISGANITGTPTVTANTTSLITATAATTGKTANITLNFAVAPSVFAATGGTVTTSGNYKIHTFTSSGTFTITSAPAGTTVEYVTVAGGAPGGSGNYGGGGGGAGGYLTGSVSGTLSAGLALTVVVGAGGSISGAAIVNGSNSSITGSGITTVNSIGGGGGASYVGGYQTAGSGGSGGGGAGGNAGGSGYAGPPRQGYNGGSGVTGSSNNPGGGGGASEAGANGVAATTGELGGAGIANPFSGSTIGQNVTGTYYLAGGGGSGIEVTSSYAGGTGGIGGGGRGGGNQGQPTAGTANTGGGGGGCTGAAAQSGANGGSGVVILRYLYQ